MRGPTSVSNTQSAHFDTTRWSLICEANNSSGDDSRKALAELCGIYWYPLYAFVRRQGFDAQSAADLIQAFFTEIIEKQFFGSAGRVQGRFRSYVLGALKHFMSDQRDKASAQKRGSGTAPISLSDAEARYGLEPSHNITPDHLFERRWALTLLGQAMDRLRQEYSKAGKQRQFDGLKDLIAGPLSDRSYADIGAQLGMTEGAVKVAVHRLKRQYRDALTAEIADTVALSDIDEEIEHLWAVIGGA